MTGSSGALDVLDRSRNRGRDSESENIGELFLGSPRSPSKPLFGYNEVWLGCSFVGCVGSLEAFILSIAGGRTSESEKIGELLLSLLSPIVGSSEYMGSGLLKLKSLCNFARGMLFMFLENRSDISIS